MEDERLLGVIRQARAMRSHGARRRHLQLIGKLMRDIDAEPIENALKAMDRQRQGEADAFHRLEQLRDDVLALGMGGTELVASRWPRQTGSNCVNSSATPARQRARQRRRQPAENYFVTSGNCGKTTATRADRSPARGALAARE